MKGIWLLKKEIKGTIYLYDIDAEAASYNEKIGNDLMAVYNPGQWEI